MRKTMIAAAAVFALPAAAFAADHTVFFDWDSARIDTAGRAALEQAAADFRASGETSISLVGHTDTSGSATYNVGLSERRARAAAQALSALGVPPGAMTLAWRGQDDPAVQTGDGVRERLNRRVEITVSAAAVEAPMAPVTVAEAVSRLRFSVGPYIGFNNENNDYSTFLGANLKAAYDVHPNVALVAEQAVFYSFGSDDEGVGGRTAAGVELNAGDFGGVTPFVGGQVGYMYVDGSATGGFFGGPSVGLRSGPFEVKAAYDFLENRSGGRGVTSLMAGYVVRF